MPIRPTRPTRPQHPHRTPPCLPAALPPRHGQALLARGDAQSDLDAAEQLLRSCLATCRRLAAATGEAGEAEMEEEEAGKGRGEGGGEGGGGGQGEGQGEAGEEGREEEGQGGLLLEANAACRREWEAAAGVRRSLAMLLCQVRLRGDCGCGGIVGCGQWEGGCGGGIADTSPN